MKMVQMKDQWDATLYDGKHQFVSKHGEGIVRLLDVQKGERILDLGCGTGDVAHTLHEQGADVTGADFSKNMVDRAKEKYPHIPFEVQDANTFSFENSFDAVFSNATLHWIKTPELVLERISTHLNKGGRFVAELGGYGNVKGITDSIVAHIRNLDLSYEESQFPWYFPSVGEYTSLMEEAGFRVTYAEHFDRPTPLADDEGIHHWIRMFCSSFFTNIEETDIVRVIVAVVEDLKESMYVDGEWIADYKRLRVIGIKE